MSQLTYLSAQPVAYVGMKGDAVPSTVETRINATASTEIPFGVFVVSGGSVGDPGAVLPSASTLKLVLGVVLHSHAYSKGTLGELGTAGLKPKTAMNILVKGRVWVMSETTAAVGDPVFVRYATGVGGTQLGAVRNATVSSEMIDLTSKGRYVTSVASAPGLALIEIDMTA